MWIFIPIIAIFTSLVDVTVSPSFLIFGGTVNFTSLVLVIFLIKKLFKGASLFLIFTTIFTHLLSQIPIIYLLVPNFILLIFFFLLTEKRIIDRPTTMLSVLIFFLSFLFFGVIKILILNQFSGENFELIIKSSIYSSFVGALLMYILIRIEHILNPQINDGRVRIKI